MFAGRACRVSQPEAPTEPSSMALLEAANPFRHRSPLERSVEQFRQLRWRCWAWRLRFQRSQRRADLSVLTVPTSANENGHIIRNSAERICNLPPDKFHNIVCLRRLFIGGALPAMYGARRPPVLQPQGQQRRQTPRCRPSATRNRRNRSIPGSS